MSVTVSIGDFSFEVGDEYSKLVNALKKLDIRGDGNKGDGIINDLDFDNSRKKLIKSVADTFETVGGLSHLQRMGLEKLLWIAPKIISLDKATSAIDKPSKSGGCKTVGWYSSSLGVNAKCWRDYVLKDIEPRINEIQDISLDLGRAIFFLKNKNEDITKADIAHDSQNGICSILYNHLAIPSVLKGAIITLLEAWNNTADYITQYHNITCNGNGCEHWSYDEISNPSHDKLRLLRFYPAKDDGYVFTRGSAISEMNTEYGCDK